MRLRVKALLLTFALLLAPASALDLEVFEELAAEFQAGRHGQVDSLVVLHKGNVVLEHHFKNDYEALFKESSGAKKPRGPYNYYDPKWHPYYQGSDLHSIQSITKTVMSALVGIAIRRGDLPGAQAKVSDYIDGVDETLTIEHLLIMRAGLAWNEDIPYEDPKNDWAAMERSSDWLKYTMDKPRVAKPGKRFLYNSGVPMMLAEVLRVATGEQVDTYAEKHLFRPLGIENHFWKKSPTGLPDAQGGLYLGSADLARFGFIYCSGELLPTDWAKRSIEPRATENSGDWKFGYQWWLLPFNDGYVMTALGYGGQRLIVFPERELVVVLNGWNLYGASTMSTSDFLKRISD